MPARNSPGSPTHDSPAPEQSGVSKTISDLLSLNIDVWNPAEDFPAEVTAEGFDNDGAQLVTPAYCWRNTSLRLRRRLNAPHTSRKSPRPNITRSKRRFISKARESKDLPKLFQEDRFRLVPETPYTDLYGRHYRGGHIASCHCYGKVASLIVVFIPSAFGLQLWGASMTMVKL